jgi:hypothetical protein
MDQVAQMPPPPIDLFGAEMRSWQPSNRDVIARGLIDYLHIRPDWVEGLLGTRGMGQTAPPPTLTHSRLSDVTAFLDDPTALVGTEGLRGGAPLGMARSIASRPPTALASVKGPYSLVGANRAVIDPRKLTEYALNSTHPVGMHKARVFQSAFGFNQSNADDLMAQIREGVMRNPATIGRIDEYGTRFTVDIPVVGPSGSGIVRTGWIYKPGSNTPELTTLIPGPR